MPKIRSKFIRKKEIKGILPGSNTELADNRSRSKSRGRTTQVIGYYSNGQRNSNNSGPVEIRRKAITNSNSLSYGTHMSQNYNNSHRNSWSSINQNTSDQMDSSTYSTSSSRNYRKSSIEEYRPSSNNRARSKSRDYDEKSRRSSKSRDYDDKSRRSSRQSSRKKNSKSNSCFQNFDEVFEQLRMLKYYMVHHLPCLFSLFL